ncbi:UDP-N-acetylglucosamine 2-epimerase (non-hydrolysing) [Gramella sp. Hel_I_59]|uniref:non-hydrolyzing UDP-N-acetylglucosamine 2-epimerase n=1 Tax=Gramella sp. Hel_I_59 TaxID=1249978 RepID=UPI0011525292|nr:UDP-N-acetylglucosamine 2-epimerase (non-hydrolyzing) [Gramella sp. Hel_I_59]TQI71535.1 UDP-N-acetylglucosamine 2-epimerase (non-hydrolysing) [Gramella sp. Hel_I_59]
MIIDLIAGARPNFVKIASLIHAIQQDNASIEFRLIHTGQHYDKNLSESFFDQLQIPDPDKNLGVGSGTQAQQTANIMMRYEALLNENKPDLCVVVGDVTSSMACAISASKLGVKVAHVEAGIRSNDKSMPEEINRILIDSISDYYFTTSRNASGLLLKQGVSKENIFFVGNTMIDTLLKFQPKFRKPIIWKDMALSKNEYFVLTLHRPSNVDDPVKLKKLLELLNECARNLPVIFPAHPRIKKFLKEQNICLDNFKFTEPISYLEFNFLVANAKCVITDSGGITEETTVLNIPCITIRENTERPETVEIGTNVIVGTEEKKIRKAISTVFTNDWKTGQIPELWDGKSGERIIKILKDFNL